MARTQLGSSLCSPTADAAFGPAIYGCRGGFDFTFTFELYFFSIVPSVLLILAAPMRLHILNGRQKKVNGNGFKSIKLSAIAIFGALQLTLAILYSTQQTPTKKASIAASTLSFVTSLMICALSYTEHSKSLRPSVLLDAYLFSSFLLDAVMLRTLWLMPLKLAIRLVSTASFAIKGVILLLEGTGKRRFFHPSHGKEHSEEETSGLYSQVFFWWLNSLIMRGFRQILKPADLSPIGCEMASETLDSKFWKVWNNSPRMKYKLIYVTISTLKWQIFLPILPRLVLLVFMFCQPLLISRFLNYLQSSTEAENQNIGYGLIGAYGLVYFGMAISGGFYWYHCFRCLTMMRGMLVAAIFRKTTEINITNVDDKAAVTLMSTDVERIVKGLREVNEVWANFVQIGLTTWLLEKELGYACAATIAVAFLSAGAVSYLSKWTKKFQGKWMTRTQKRIGITSSMLGSMRGIKMLGLAQKLTEMVADLRFDEVEASKDFRHLGVFSSTIAYFPLMISPVLTFAIYTAVEISSGGTLDVSRLFTSLSLLLLLSQPLFTLFASITDSMSAIGCFERVENYLQAEPRVDYRLIIGEPRSFLQHSYKSHSAKEINLTTTGPDIELRQVEPTPSTQIGSEIISIRDGNFGWIAGEKPILRDINLSFQRSKFTLLIGPSASGKSTLLKALLGETPNSKGFVYFSNAKVAWCEQTPWLINDTVQKNIIGFSNFDPNLYETVIRCCDLETYIDLLPNGDQTMIGSKGTTLSGGQKQRLAIARAVYSMADIAIFDDIFSGLDVATEKKVFNNLFGPEGLLRRWGTTIIVATHAVNLLPWCDHIVALGSDGTISEQGSFEVLNACNGYVRSFCLEQADSSSPIRTIATPLSKPKSPYTFGKEKRDAASLSTTAIGNKKRQIGDVSVYLYYFRALGWSFGVLFFTLEILWAFFSAFPTIWLKWWADANARNPNQQTGLYLGVYSALQVAGLLVGAALTWFCFSVMARNSGIRLHFITLKAVMSAPIAFFSRTDTGSITTRLSQDIHLIDMAIPLQLMCVMQSFFTCIAQAGLIASATGWIALSFPPLLFVFYMVQTYYLRTSRQIRLLDLEEKAPVYTQFLETLGGLTSIRAFGWQKELQQANYQLVDRSQKPFYLMFMIQRWLTLVLDLTTMSLAVIVVGIAVGLRASISVGLTGVALTQIISFTGYLKQTIIYWTQLETSLGAVARIKQFSTDTEDENLPTENQDPPPDWPSRGHVEYLAVSATYGSADSDIRALEGISLSIEAGQKIGICGRTGSGKSSLVLALVRMIELSSGTIRIDGLDIATIPRHYVRSRLNAISQEPFFLTGNVRLNLDPYESSSDESMIEVLNKVQLWTTIEAKGGLNSPLGEDMLSHGQRQLFCLARAILRPGKIVILDEATSSVDRKTDELLQQIIREEFKSHTVIAIAHRLDTILDFDRIAVVEQSMLVECDTPAKLLQGPSRFKELYESYEMERSEDTNEDASGRRD